MKKNIKNKNKIALITGSAGFIGYHMSLHLLNLGWSVVGVDNFNHYYYVNLKKKRHKLLLNNKNFVEFIGDINKENFIFDIVQKYKPNILIHFAAQAGVRYSLKNPTSYINSNILGTFRVLEAIKNFNLDHLLIASTSSVYGNSKNLPYTENNSTDHPISFYAATKKSIEAISHSYSHLYNIPTTIFRFFTVYGPWGRPDMALFKFVHAIINDKKIQLYNNGNMKRDFTYIDDLIESISRLIEVLPKDYTNELVNNNLDSKSNSAPWRTVNIGNSKIVEMKKFVKVIEKKLNKKAKVEYVSYHMGEVLQTHASSKLLNHLVGYEPRTLIENGVENFIKWYREYYKT